MQFAFDEAYDTVLTTLARRDRLDKAILTMAAEPAWSPVVARLGCLRGVGTLTGFGLAVEIGDWQRLGKTLSARTYAAADDWEQWLIDRYTRDTVLPDSLVNSRTIVYTPYVNITARRLDLELDLHTATMSSDINRVLDPECHPDIDLEVDIENRTELVIIDEADRLKTTALEQLRDFFGRRDLGLILIGMPGFDRQLARYPQLYSRIGFAHQYRPIDPEDISTVLAHYWQQLGHTYDPDDPDHLEAAHAVTGITGGNFRLIERLMTQIARVIDINDLDNISPDVVHAARQMLVIGTQ